MSEVPCGHLLGCSIWCTVSLQQSQIAFQPGEKYDRLLWSNWGFVDLAFGYSN